MDNHTKQKLLTALQQSFIGMAELDFGFLTQHNNGCLEPSQEFQDFKTWAKDYAKDLARTENKTYPEMLIELREQKLAPFRSSSPSHYVFHLIHLYHRYGIDFETIKDWVKKEYIEVIAKVVEFYKDDNGEHIFTYDLFVDTENLEKIEETDDILRKLKETYQNEKEQEERLNPRWEHYVLQLTDLIRSKVQDCTINQLLGMGLALLACNDDKDETGCVPLLGNLVLDGLEENTNFPGALPADLDFRKVITSNKILKAAQRLFCMPPGALSEDGPYPSNIFNSSELETLFVESQREIEKKDARITELEAKLAELGATDTEPKIELRTHAASQARQEKTLNAWKPAIDAMIKVAVRCGEEGPALRQQPDFNTMFNELDAVLIDAQMELFRKALPDEHIDRTGGLRGKGTPS